MPYVEWNQGCGGYNLNWWIRRPTDPDKDWAGVALPQSSRGGTFRGPADNSTDFPDRL